ncbi:MAG: metallophosphoesterase [Bacteroidota bacterium]
MPLSISRRTFLYQASSLGVSLSLPDWRLSGGAAKPVLRFGLMTDSHYADREAAGIRYYRESLDKMAACIRHLNRKQLDFAIHLGDFKDEDPGKKEADTLRYLKAMEAEFARFKGPRYHCVGNHDVDSITKAQFQQHIENTGIAAEKSYYTFEQKGIRCIVLDANYHPDGRDHFYQEAGTNWQQSFIPQAQLDWLRGVLNGAQKPTLVFCHHPLYRYESENTYYVENHEAVQRILEASGQILAVLHGHTHSEKTHVQAGITYATFLGMVDYSGRKNNAYAVIEVFGDGRIEVTGYKRLGDRAFSPS